MAFWKFSDDTILRTGALVEGCSAFAIHLRKDLYELAYGEGPLVWLAEDKDGAVELDPHSDWLLNLWAHNEAKLAGLSIEETSYSPKEQDIPPNALEHLRRHGMA